MICLSRINVHRNHSKQLNCYYLSCGRIYDKELIAVAGSPTSRLSEAGPQLLVDSLQPQIIT